jgi:hypothetical protein
MSPSRYLSLLTLWLRLKRLLRETLAKGVSWSRLDQLFMIINDWITLERRPRTPENDEQITPSKSGPQTGADPVSNTNEHKYRLY